MKSTPADQLPKQIEDIKRQLANIAAKADSYKGKHATWPMVGDLVHISEMLSEIESFINS